MRERPPVGAILLVLGLFVAAPALAADALTESLGRESRRGTVAERAAPAATPVTATIEGVVMRGCADRKTPCTPYFYIALPNQLDALMSGGRPMSDAECREKGQPMGCARGVQIELKERTGEVLGPLVGRAVSVSGTLMDSHAENHELPAVMRVEKLSPGAPPARR